MNEELRSEIKRIREENEIQGVHLHPLNFLSFNITSASHYDRSVHILEYVRSFRRKVLRTLYIQRLICSKQEYFFFREYNILANKVGRNPLFLFRQPVFFLAQGNALH